MKGHQLIAGTRFSFINEEVNCDGSPIENGIYIALTEKGYAVHSEKWILIRFSWNAEVEYRA